ncbi:MAG: FAD-dependent monooxygenase [Alphaproteobacteria bacterium]
MENQTNISIIGAGPIGSILAGTLVQAGFSVSLLDQKPLPHQKMVEGVDGRLIALTPASQIFFQQIGLWELMRAHATPLDEVHASNQGRGQVTFSKTLNRGNPLGYMIPFETMRTTIVEWAGQFDIQYQGGVDVESIIFETPYGIVGGQQKGQPFVAKASLIIGADGKNSLSRSLVGLPCREWDYDQQAFVATYQHSLAHENKAYEFFLPTGPFAILPAQGGYQSSIVWTVENSYAENLLQVSEAEFDAKVAEHMEFLGGITRKGSLHTYSLTGNFMSNFVKPRFCLVGDAAHGMHPLAGQGFNLGVQDVENLVNILGKSRDNGLDVGSYSMLQTFERRQRPHHAKMLLAMHGLNWLFSNDNRALDWIRDMGLDGVDRSERLKKLFV